jgi:recombination DNA repair RAD52 pathway protein
MSEQATKQTANAGTPDEKIKEVNQILLDSEPGDISTDSYSGNAGYKPQFIIDAMNKVFGIGGWGFDELSTEVITTNTEKGISALAVAKVRVWIKGIVSLPIGYGQARVTKGDLGDAKKGAQTDALKKALSYFSIGNRAYHGKLRVASEQHS